MPSSNPSSEVVSLIDLIDQAIDRCTDSRNSGDFMRLHMAATDLALLAQRLPTINPLCDKCGVTMTNDEVESFDCYCHDCVPALEVSA